MKKILVALSFLIVSAPVFAGECASGAVCTAPIILAPIGITYQDVGAAPASGSQLMAGEVPSGAINGSNTTYTISRAPSSGAIAFYVNGLLQKAGTDYTLTGTTIAWLNTALNSPDTIYAFLIDDGSAYVTTVGSFGSTPDAKGASISGQTITMQPADATHPGEVTTGAQTFAGAKTFSGGVVATVTGNADTATALASNPTDCGANTYATTIAANGNLTCAAIATAGLATVQGNGTKVQLSTGTTTTNNCVKFDANGNTVDAGAACGSGGGGSVATDSIWGAAGDIVVGTGTGTAARMAKGTSLQVLRMNSGATAEEWATPAAGTVTSLTCGTGLTGGTITATGTCALDPSTVPAITGTLAAGDVLYGTSSTAVARLNGTGPLMLNGASAPTVGTYGGNTTKFQMMGAGTPATDDCAKFDANNNLVSAGAACGAGGGGSGTVSSGTQYNIPFYTAAGTGTTIGPSGVTCTSDGTSCQTIKGTSADRILLRAGTTGGENTGWEWSSSASSMANTFTAVLPSTEPTANQALCFGTPSSHVSALSYCTPVVNGADASFGVVTETATVSTGVAKGTVSSGTVTFTASSGEYQSLTVGGDLTIATAGWPTTGSLGFVMVQLVNGAAHTITWPTIHWMYGDGTSSTTFPPSVALYSSGTNWMALWSVDGGTTVYGKVQ